MDFTAPQFKMLNEAGVLDYTGPNRTYATPNPVPVKSIEQNNLTNQHSDPDDNKSMINVIYDHFKSCPHCSKSKNGVCDKIRSIVFKYNDAIY